MIAEVTSRWSGFMIALVMPAPMAIDRKAPVMLCLAGSPKLTFDAPQVVFTWSSSRRRR